VQTVLVNGFFVGLVYGLVAVGLVVTYRCSRAVNFAYGETGMIGAFVFTELWVDVGVSVWVALAAGIGLSAAIGAATELAVIRPLRDQPRLAAMVGTLAVGSLLVTYAGRRYGVSPRFTFPLVTGDGYDVAGVHVMPQQLLILVSTIVVVGGLAVLHRYTSFGLRLRASALDPYAAGLVGVRTDAVSLVTWTLAGALAGFSAILIAPSSSMTVFFMGTLLLRSLAAAVIGGLTSIAGALTAGIGLGLLEALIGYKSPTIGVTEVVLAVLVIGVLLVRPQGLVPSRY
jgi:branched-subunit amino acid ABC-type transport system permease component